MRSEAALIGLPLTNLIFSHRYQEVQICPQQSTPASQVPKVDGAFPGQHSTVRGTPRLRSLEHLNDPVEHGVILLVMPSAWRHDKTPGFLGFFRRCHDAVAVHDRRAESVHFSRLSETLAPGRLAAI